MREERKVVTALFADVVGSTQLTERMDPEDAREVLGDAVRRMVDAVEAFGGTVKDLAGDGILALFGAPVTHEDDAERAIRAALRIVGRNDGDASPVEIRVGIETGLVVLGPIGGGGRVEYGATGDALNTAARLQSHAPPGRVLVGDVTRRAAGDLFVWGEEQRLELKGKDEPVSAFEVAGERRDARSTSASDTRWSGASSSSSAPRRPPTARSPARAGSSSWSGTPVSARAGWSRSCAVASRARRSPGSRDAASRSAGPRRTSRSEI